MCRVDRRGRLQRPPAAAAATAAAAAAAACHRGVAVMLGSVNDCRLLLVHNIRTPWQLPQLAGTLAAPLPDSFHRCAARVEWCGFDMMVGERGVENVGRLE